MIGETCANAVLLRSIGTGVSIAIRRPGRPSIVVDPFDSFDGGDGGDGCALGSATAGAAAAPRAHAAIAHRTPRPRADLRPELRAEPGDRPGTTHICSRSITTRILHARKMRQQDSSRRPGTCADKLF